MSDDPSSLLSLTLYRVNSSGPVRTKKKVRAACQLVVLRAAGATGKLHLGVWLPVPRRWGRVVSACNLHGTGDRTRKRSGVHPTRILGWPYCKHYFGTSSNISAGRPPDERSGICTKTHRRACSLCTTRFLSIPEIKCLSHFARSCDSGELKAIFS